NQKPIPFYDFDHRGASAVWSSAHDLIRFGMFHLKNHLEDQKQILKDETIDTMQQEKDPEVPDSEYRLGWSLIDLHGYRFVSHSGGMPGVSTRLTLIPSENLATVLLCNGETPDLWKIELAIYAALLPEAAKKLEVEKIKPEEEELVKFSPPESLLGEWVGEVKTDNKTQPARLVIKENAQVSLELDGKIFSPLNMKTPLGDMQFKDGVFQGPFYGNFNTFESARSPHIPFIRVKLQGQSLSGYIAAVAVNQSFCLPFWIELKKKVS
ncbi:MAG: serine hydrolase, partial [Candidatus Aminicenantes bacterium]|nr:serine hydrolase [Candidatus Aminicenantes bacterium]